MWRSGGQVSVLEDRFYSLVEVASEGFWLNSMPKADSKVSFTTHDLNLVWMDALQHLYCNEKVKLFGFEVHRDISSIYSDYGALEIITN